MEADNIIFQWSTWRGNNEEEFNAYLNNDERNDKVEIPSIEDKILTEEENCCLHTYPLTQSYALKTGDISETVNMLTDIEELQRELRTALSVESKVSRSGNHEVSEQFSRASAKNREHNHNVYLHKR